MPQQCITVLTPRGRRQKIDVSPNMTVLEILETVCQKHGFDASEYELKNHNKILDLSIMYRFSGLANNATVEMVGAKLKRKENDVIIGIQLEDGTRLTATFKPTTFLLDTIKQLCPEQLNSPNNPILVYMRKEIFGEELGTTTLKSLGLTSGRAILRLMNKSPEELKHQANVSAPLPAKNPSPTLSLSSTSSSADDMANKFENKVREIENKPSIMHAIKKDMNAKQDSAEKDAGKKEIHNKPEESMDIDGIDETPENSRYNDSKKCKKDDRSYMISDESKDASDYEEPEIITLGERNAVFFSMESANRDNMDCLPDSFFDITVADVRKIYNDLKAQVNNLDDAPLLTAQLRQLEEDKRILNQLGKYKQSVIRIQFPDRHVLQGTFSPIDKIIDVINFVRNYLKDSSLDFHLYTTPPKKVLEPSLRIIEADCVPQALLHFGLDKPFNPNKDNLSFIKEEYYKKLTSSGGANLAASKSRGIAKTHSGVSNDADCGPSTSNYKSAPEQKPKIPDNFLVSKTSGTSTDSKNEKLPKWFKPTGK